MFEFFLVHDITSLYDFSYKIPLFYTVYLLKHFFLILDGINEKLLSIIKGLNVKYFHFEVLSFTFKDMA